MPGQRPLKDQTVLLTRPREASESLAAALRRLGARLVHAPAIRIAPPSSWKALDAALRSLSRFDAVVFTSANAVAGFFQRARRLGLKPARPRHLYAIGPATARALAARGWRGASVPEAHEGAALARHMGRMRGLSVLIPRARVAREELPDLLRRAGARVRTVEVYRTLPDPAGLRRIRRVVRGGEASWVAFASASAVEQFARATGDAAVQARLRAASIGPVTSAALRRHGLEPAAEAATATSEGLVRAILEKSRPPDVPALQETLVRALKQAGDILRGRFGKVRIRYKGLANIVTAADHASERAILKTILGRFPDHDLLTEESGGRSRGSDCLWIVDPLDGTTNYAHGYPACCVSIGLLHRRKPLLGGVYDPFRDELFLARRGGGTTLNGRPIAVSRVGSVREALLLTGFAYDRAKRAGYYLRFYETFMKRCHDVRRSGSAALDLAWTAAGRVEGYWEFNLSPWDVAAGMLLVEEAGGKVTDFSGKGWEDPMTFGCQTLASNGRVHAEMLRLIRRHL